MITGTVAALNLPANVVVITDDGRRVRTPLKVGEDGRLYVEEPSPSAGAVGDAGED